MGKVTREPHSDSVSNGRRDSETGRKSYNHPCTIARTLDILGDRWTLLIIRDLMAGLHRYGDILGSCAGMSPNVLSDRLKRLEADGLVNREYHRELPPRVEYSLTEKGWAVRPVLLALLDWGHEHVGRVDEASVGTTVSTDFAVRTIPTLAFQPARAVDLQITMVVELNDCEDCNTWTFAIHDGHIHPRRRAVEAADVRLKTTTQGFFQFLHGNVAPEDCGEIEGSPEQARAIQACFVVA